MTRRDAPPDVIEVEGAGGASCAPLLRASLCLSIVTQRPFRATWHDGVGLTRDAADALRLATLLGGTCDGATEGASHLLFTPSPTRTTTLRADVSGMGALASLEMLAVALAFARAPVDVRLNGVTHPVRDVSFHETVLGWVPLLERVGLTGEFRLDAAGFSNEAPGAVSARIFPTPKLRPIDLSQRGMLQDVQAIVLIGNLGLGVALPIERRLNERLRARGIVAQVEMLPLPIEKGRGLCVVLVAQFERTRVAFSVTGEPGQSADSLAEATVERLQQFLRHRGAVPGDVASRLLVPLALASSSLGAPGTIGQESRGTSRLATTEMTGDLIAIAGLVRRFLDVDVQLQGLPGDEGLVELRPRVAEDA